MQTLRCFKLLLVAWYIVFTFTDGLVASSILDVAGIDGGCDGSRVRVVTTIEFGVAIIEVGLELVSEAMIGLERALTASTTSSPAGASLMIAVSGLVGAVGCVAVAASATFAEDILNERVFQ